jgi:hypothetical protein
MIKPSNIFVSFVGVIVLAHVSLYVVDGSILTAQDRLAALPFMYGADSRSNVDAHLLTKMGATHVRVYATWKDIQKTVTKETLNTTITVEWLRKNSDFIDKWSSSRTWSYLDSYVDGVVGAGLAPIIEIGEGTIDCLPTFVSNGTLCDPNVIGKNTYLAYMYLQGRAIVRRYKHACTMYQIENELNEARFESWAGIRRSAGFFKPNLWGDWDFLTELLRTLAKSVKDEDSSLLVTHNFHTDIPKEVHTVLNTPGYFVEAAQNWSSILDLVAIDAYPNYFTPTPSRGSIVGNRVHELRQVLPATQPVYVQETGYSVTNVTSPPAIFDYSEQMQAQYFEDAYRSSVAGGAIGFFPFMVIPERGRQLPPGGYTDEDVKVFTLLSNLAQTLNVTEGLNWIQQKDSIHYLTSRFAQVEQASEDGWGLLREDSSYRPAYYALQRLYKH